MPKKLFRIDFYHVHGHAKNAPVDYVRLLDALQSIRGYDLKVANHHTAVGTANLASNGGQLFLIVYTGYSAKTALFFDLLETKELTQVTRPDRFPARKTYAMIDARKRLLAIESKKGYVGPSLLSRLIEEYFHTLTDSEFKTLELNFSPVVDETFVDKLNEFERIKSATITIVRPNVDWTDQHDKLTEIAQESDAKSLGVEAHSKRAKSLAKKSGIIQFIKTSAASKAKSLFQKIKIVGSLSDDSGLITLDLNKHIKYSNVPIDFDTNTGQPNDTDAASQLSKALRDAKQSNEED